MGDGPLGQHRPADDRLADAHLRPVPRLHGRAHRDRRLHAAAALRTFLTMLLYLVGIVLFAMGTMVVVTLPMPQVPA